MQGYITDTILLLVFIILSNKMKSELLKTNDKF